jgi:hypothetical protein
MSNVINGTFTLSQMLDMTYHSKYKTRFEYKERDVLKRVTMIKQTELHPDRPYEPTITYIFKSESYPQYGSYLRYTAYHRQRKFHHEYDNILSVEADEEGKFSMNSTQWKYRLGSQAQWNDKPPQDKIKSIYRETYTSWKKDYDRKVVDIKNKSISKETKDKLLKSAKKDFERRIESHRKIAPYVDVGDFNSKVKGINGDFFFRVAPLLQKYGHLYGKSLFFPNNVDSISPFLPKHAIALIDYLVKKKILY